MPEKGDGLRKEEKKKRPNERIRKMGVVCLRIYYS